MHTSSEKANRKSNLTSCSLHHDFQFIKTYIYLILLGSFYSYLVGLEGDKGCFLLFELKPRDVDKLLPNRLNEFCAVSDGGSFLLSKAVFESYSEVGVSSLRKNILGNILSLTFPACF